MAKIHTLQKAKRSNNAPNINIKERDIEILQNIANFRILEARQIAVLHPEIGDRTLKRRLQLLFHNGYLDRPARQFAYYGPSRHIIYALGRQGAKLIFNDQRANLDWTEKNRNLKTTTFEHALAISNVLIASIIALRNQTQTKLLKWGIESPRTRLVVDGEATTLRPDAFFTFQDKKRGELNYFLEVDRSTTDHKRFLRKMRTYWQLWKQQAHKKKYGIDRFRVLTTTISENRSENLRLLTKNADGRQEGSEMFLFACEKSFDIENPKTLFEPIWKSPKNNKLHHLLE